ncbi:uncharacterized protein [Musca autumnalis]|uniref:uncharacterized protein n=1 Tax=Musca autumnalis TaxID=221902 RepID=UPI003CF0BA0F
MNKFLIICLVALTVEVALGAPNGNVEDNKRYQLFETVAEKLQTSVWSEEIYKKFAEYMNGVKEWSESDESLQKSTIYNKLQEQIEKCLNIVNELEADPHNCARQLALKESHNEIRSLFDSVEEDKLRRDWVKKYMNFVVPMRSISTKANEEFYAFLKETVDNYLNSVSDASNFEDLSQWHKKFARQTDYVKQQKMVMEFMKLFPAERASYEGSKCEIQYSNGL